MRSRSWHIGATSDGRIRLHPQSVKAVGMPIGGLMGALHLELDDLVSSNRARGFEARTTTFCHPGSAAAGSETLGRLTRIRIGGRSDRGTFGQRRRPMPRWRELHALPGKPASIRPLTRNDTDMRLIDADPSDPFDSRPASTSSTWSRDIRRTRPTAACASICRTTTRRRVTIFAQPVRDPEAHSRGRHMRQNQLVL